MKLTNIWVQGIKFTIKYEVVDSLVKYATPGLAWEDETVENYFERPPLEVIEGHFKNRVQATLPWTKGGIKWLVKAKELGIISLVGPGLSLTEDEGLYLSFLKGETHNPWPWEVHTPMGLLIGRHTVVSRARGGVSTVSSNRGSWTVNRGEGFDTFLRYEALNSLGAETHFKWVLQGDKESMNSQEGWIPLTPENREGLYKFLATAKRQGKAFFPV